GWVYAPQPPPRSIGVFLRQRQGLDRFLLQLSPFPQVQKRSRLHDVEQDEDVDITDFARQFLAMRRRNAALLIPRSKALKDALDSIAPNQRGVILRVGCDLHRFEAKLGVLV